MQLVLVLALVASAPSVAGGDTGSLAVIAVDGCTSELTSGSTRLLREALSAQQGFKLKSEDEIIGQFGGSLRGSLQDAQRLLAGARTSFQEGMSSQPKAEKALREAMAVLMALPPSEPRRWQTIQEVASFQAMIYQMDGKPEAEQVLEPVLRIDPAFEPDHERYSPAMWSLADEVRKRLRERATATLSVSSKPSGIPISVDGRIVGRSPVSLSIPPGDYRVEGVFGTERSLARTVHVNDVTSVELDQTFDGSIRVSAGPCIATSGTRESRLAALMKLAVFLGTNQVVGLWQEEPTGGEVYLVAAAVDAASGQELREAKVKISGGRASAHNMKMLAQFISTGSAGPPVEAVVSKPRLMPGAITGMVSAEREAQSSRRTWGLVAGGSGLAAVAAGAVFDIMSHSAYNDEKKASAAGDVARYDSALSSATSRQSTAKILYIVGALGVGAGTYLYLTGREGSVPVAVAPVEGGAVAIVSGSLP